MIEFVCCCVLCDYGMLTYLSGPVYVAYSTKTLITSVITLQWNPLSSNQNQFHEGALLDQNHIKSCLLVRANHPTLEKGIFREEAGFKKPVCDRNLTPSVQIQDMYTRTKQMKRFTRTKVRLRLHVVLVLSGYRILQNSSDCLWACRLPLKS